MTSPSLRKEIQNFSDAFLEAEAKAPQYHRNKVSEDADGSPEYPPVADTVIETTTLAKNEERLDRERLRESLWYWRGLVSSITSLRKMVQSCENPPGGEPDV
jgi:hypothetical protein